MIVFGLSKNKFCSVVFGLSVSVKSASKDGIAVVKPGCYGR